MCVDVLMSRISDWIDFCAERALSPSCRPHPCTSPRSRARSRGRRTSRWCRCRPRPADSPDPWDPRRSGTRRTSGSRWDGGTWGGSPPGRGHRSWADPWGTRSRSPMFLRKSIELKPILCWIPLRRLTLLGIAAFALGSVRPDTGAGVLVEVEAHGALGLQGVALDAVVEDVAHSRVRMGEESVLTGTVLAGLGLLYKKNNPNRKHIFILIFY